ncbi:glycoside hydrolase family 32 protein [Oerskovia flava]|uniref:glycoside hydrolase family 32 protein n=1 Tax=Oerskovia flava TaxID=2986422 RepID=UPI0022406BF3|nr:glycoside hydrolase family 32 protein [Oerskovia sp. JB1-3-2]
MPDVGHEPYRPGLHYSPAQNWMNDPNGLVFHDGTYHLYYQHNPYGTSWGNMSWGHATSPDLLTWTEQPVAIPQTLDADGVSVEDIFSGSVVVDHGNTSGFGTVEDPPLVAVYTSAYTPAHPTLAGIQAQSLAYSTDGGYTWTKYAANPVLDRDSANFRDPKVFWYDGGTPETSYWVMVAVEAVDHQVEMYRSADLKDWDHLSTFGPANAVGGIWECPDLFELAVDGDPQNTRWVLVVNLNPGSIGGGSGGQYFVGDFDGTTFTSESTVEGVPVPDGDLLADFEGPGWDSPIGEWTVSNEPGNEADGPFGTAPANGAVNGQQAVTGFVGTGLANSFVGGDWPVGTLESPPFAIERDHLSLLVGGGKHPRVPGAQLGNEPPVGSLLWDGFELPDGETLADVGWTGTGDLAATESPSTSGGDYYLGARRINTFDGGPRGDDNVGTLTSPEFTIDAGHLSMLVGGGRRVDSDDQVLQVQLLVDGDVVRHLTGPQAGALNWQSWDVTDLRGSTARLRVVDEATGGWGHLTLDHVVLSDEPALVRSDETSVNLVVDGEVVRSATGRDSEHLDWTSWDVRDLHGQQATIRVVDNNRFGWGHVLLDQVVATDHPTDPVAESYGWLDWGRDYYATVSFDNAPDDRRLMVGWMNNWSYSGATPTSGWRSAMTLPREVTLTDSGGRIELAQRVVPEIDELAGEPWTGEPGTVVAGTHPLPVTGDLLQIDLDVDPGTAERVGLAVRTSAGFSADGRGTGEPAPEESATEESATEESSTEEGTLVLYDARTGRVVVDRTRSGDVGFHPDFASVSSMPVEHHTDGTVHLSVYVDRASVEVFAADGTRTITDQVFPDPSSLGLALVAEGGEAEIRSLTVTPLRASMFAEPTPTVELDVDVDVDARCLGGKAYVAVRATNQHDEPVVVGMESAYGSRTSTVSPGKFAYQAFGTRATRISAGEVNVVGTTVDGGLSRAYSVAHGPIDCG